MEMHLKRVPPQPDERVHWSDRDALIPAGLGVAGVPAEVAGLYLKMKTVGTESRSALNRLKNRTGWGRDKLKKWQNVAWELGWLFLLSEGRAAGDGKTGIPRQWWLPSRPFEAPPLDVVTSILKVSGVLELPLQPMTWGRVLKTSNLSFRTQTSSLKDQQALKRDIKRERALDKSKASRKAKPSLDSATPQFQDQTRQDQQAALGRLSAVRLKSRYREDLLPSPADLKAALDLERLFGSDLEAAYINFLRDTADNLIKNAHPLRFFLTTANSYRPTPKKPPLTSKVSVPPPESQLHNELMENAMRGMTLQQRVKFLAEAHRA